MVNEIIFSLGVGNHSLFLDRGAVIYFIFSQVKLSRLKECWMQNMEKKKYLRNLRKDKKKNWHSRGITVMLQIIWLNL